MAQRFFGTCVVGNSTRLRASTCSNPDSNLVEYGLKLKKVFNCTFSLLSVTIALGTSVSIVDNMLSFNTQ